MSASSSPQQFPLFSRVQSYYGDGKTPRDHENWETEMAESEVLVMTPQILLHSLQHCFIKMDSIALLIFDECHHAQVHKRHPYAQIMKVVSRSSSCSTICNAQTIFI
uniref:DEAD/DEAH-box helicase domain-containing protein n=1 Tax=Aegilops tauschii subsp. strangulata TaxID=200361 RepID=A0A453CF10_AEGTS